MRTFVAVMLGICFTSASGCDRAKKELDRLQGEWEVVRIEVAGKEIPLEKVLDRQYTVKGDQLIPSKNPNDPGTLELRPEKKPAWHIGLEDPPFNGPDDLGDVAAVGQFLTEIQQGMRLGVEPPICGPLDLGE